MSKSDFLAAFAPINVVTIGGFLSVTYFKNRESTGDLDYMIDPEWIEDDEIKTPLKDAINSVAKKEKLELDWMNDGLEIWATPTALKTIFEQAYAQNIILFDGQSLKVGRHHLNGHWKGSLEELHLQTEEARKLIWKML